MAVIINGDTGIDKITDGSIVAADIGAGEVTDAKLASTLDLSGKTMTYGNLPAANLTGSLPAGMGGKILQAVTDTKVDTFSTTSTSFVDVTGLSVSITPSSASSKILVMFSICFHASNAASGHIRFMRNSTMMVQPTSASSRPLAHGSHFNISQESNLSPTGFSFLDSPSTTSAVIYKPQIRSADGSTMYLNRTALDYDNGYYGRHSSTIIALEVAG